MNLRRTQIIELGSTNSRAASPETRINAASPGRLGRRRTAGFTLIELMVALTVGSLAVATFYTVARHTTLFFQEQSRVSNLQDHMRFAMAQVKRDIKRAGYLAPPPPVVASPTLCRGPIASLVPAGGLATAGAIALHARNSPNNATSGIDPGNLYGTNANVRVDRLVLLGNYETGASYPATFNLNSSAVTVTVAAGDYAALRDFGDWANGAPAASDAASVRAAFAPDRPIIIEGAGGMRHYARTVTVADNIGTGGGIRLTFTPPANAGQCPLGLTGWMAPLKSVEYTVLSAANAVTLAAATNRGLLLDPDETLPQLHRREFNLNTNLPMTAANGGEDRTILDYVVAFHVDFIVDGGTTLTNNVDNINWVAENAAARATAAANPETIRGARILLAARASGHDRSLSPIGVGPLQVFQINNMRRGGARVRTLRADIFIPNLAIQ